MNEPTDEPVFINGKWVLIPLDDYVRLQKMEEKLRSLLFYVLQRPELNDNTSADYSRQVKSSLRLLSDDAIEQIKQSFANCGLDMKNYLPEGD